MSQETLSPCPLCKTENPDVLSTLDRHGNPLVTTCCKSCGLVYNNPIPDEGALEAFYRDSYRKSYKSTLEPKRKHHVRYGALVCDQVLAAPEVYKTVQTVLDVGSGSGEFSALMQEMGKTIDAIEPTKGYANYCRQVFKLPIFCGSVTEFESTRTYDLIRLNHVLEHMRDPAEKLAGLRERLSDDGWLYVEVPDVLTYARTKTPGKMFHFGHIYNFDQKTLIAFAARAGFTPAKVVGPTAIYFKKSAPHEAIPTSENYQAVKEIYDQHVQGAFRAKESGANRLGRKLVKAAKEFIMVKSLRTPSNIIKHYHAEVAKQLGPMNQA